MNIMQRTLRKFGLLLAGGLVLLLSACAFDGDFIPAGQDITLPLLPGDATLQVGHSELSALHMPESEQLNSGNILMFSPIEFRSRKDHFNYEAAALPLGRYVAVRHSGEGITADLPPQQAQTFRLRYDAHYPDLASARRNFPGLKQAQYRQVTIDGKPGIEITQWRLRLSMIFSRERNAFRVLLDDLEYRAPRSRVPASEETQSTAETTSLPVIVAFSYQHPDNKHELLVQQNIFFEFTVENRDSGFHVTPQISGWVPLTSKPEKTPYTVGIVVAEVHEKREDFYKKLYNLVRNVRGFI